MAEEEQLQVVTLRDDFYHDGIYLTLATVIILSIAILAIITISAVLFFHKPRPVSFPVGEDWRVVQPVPVDQPYLSVADMLQWVTTALPMAFNLDFINYNADLTKASQYFTANGWKSALNQININADYNSVQTAKLFVSGSPGGAPFVLNQGLLQGRYAWWVQMPITINYASYEKTYSKSLVLQVLVVRVPTLTNLAGVGIDNVLVNMTK